MACRLETEPVASSSSSDADEYSALLLICFRATPSAPARRGVAVADGPLAVKPNEDATGSEAHNRKTIMGRAISVGYRKAA
mmetsp:Transcript_18228/g.38254  ORF Transcript_18228/g.38254 Transcript_18228/m.38254 type:complete len:81 (-) Transcript_18228:90-332(-)